MFEEQINNGVKLLNKKKPNWFNFINLNKFDMENCQSCLLSQIYQKNYRDSLDNLFTTKEIDKDLDYDHGFGLDDYDNYPILTEEWKEAIIKLRNGSILDIKPEDQEKIYTKDEIKNLLVQVMELGMTTRENQLNCSELRCGRKVLEEFIKTNL
jgi:hypothetical protein